MKVHKNFFKYVEISATSIFMGKCFFSIFGRFSVGCWLIFGRCLNRFSISFSCGLMVCCIVALLACCFVRCLTKQSQARLRTGPHGKWIHYWRDVQVQMFAYTFIFDMFVYVFFGLFVNSVAVNFVGECHGLLHLVQELLLHMIENNLCLLSSSKWLASAVHF